jgi:hypothetical protein
MTRLLDVRTNRMEIIEQAKTVFYLANNKKEIIIDTNIDFDRPDILLLIKIAQGEVEDAFTAHSVYRHNWKGLHIAQVKVGISVLVDTGALVPDVVMDKIKGGRPKTVYWFSDMLIQIKKVNE